MVTLHEEQNTLSMTKHTHQILPHKMLIIAYDDKILKHYEK